MLSRGSLQGSPCWWGVAVRSGQGVPEHSPKWPPSCSITAILCCSLCMLALFSQHAAPWSVPLPLPLLPPHPQVIARPCPPPKPHPAHAARSAVTAPASGGRSAPAAASSHAGGTGPASLGQGTPSPEGTGQGHGERPDQEQHKVLTPGSAVPGNSRCQRAGSLARCRFDSV